MRRSFALRCWSACPRAQPDTRAAGEVSEVLTVACNVDGVVVPVAQPIVATSASKALSPPTRTCWCIPRLSRHANVSAAYR